LDKIKTGKTARNKFGIKNSWKYEKDYYYLIILPFFLQLPILAIN